MNVCLRFLRNLDKRKLIFILQRASALLLPMRPYAACSRSSSCPCPLSKQLVQGMAVGGQTASVHIETGNTVRKE